MFGGTPHPLTLNENNHEEPKLKGHEDLRTREEGEIEDLKSSRLDKS